MKRKDLVLLFLFLIHLIIEFTEILNGNGPINIILDIVITFIIAAGWFFLLYKEFYWFYVLNVFFIILTFPMLIVNYSQFPVASSLNLYTPLGILFSIVYVVYILYMTRKLYKQRRRRR